VCAQSAGGRLRRLEPGLCASDPELQFRVRESQLRHRAVVLSAQKTLTHLDSALEDTAPLV